MSDEEWTIRRDEIIGWLTDDFPGLFDFLDPKPLAHGSIPDIADYLDIDINEVGPTIRWWTQRRPYLRALVAGCSRYNLDGVEDGIVSPEEEQAASERLARIARARTLDAERHALKAERLDLIGQRNRLARQVRRLKGEEPKKSRGAMRQENLQDVAAKRAYDAFSKWELAFPGVFDFDNPLPLSYHDDVPRRLKEIASGGNIVTTYMKWTRRPEYLQALANGKYLFNLDGTVAGPIPIEARHDAKTRLNILAMKPMESDPPSHDGVGPDERQGESPIK